MENTIYYPTTDTAVCRDRKIQYISGTLYGKHVADICFEKGVISATDPCFSEGRYYRVDNIKIIPGDYQINTYTDNNGRVRILQIVLKDENVIKRFNDTYYNINRSWRTISTDIGVDAGICGFFQCKPNFNDEEWDKFCQDIRYDSEGNLWAGEKPEEKGFFTESGWGDGVYSCHAIRDRVGPNKKYGIVALELRF